MIEFKRIAPTPEVAKQWKREKMNRDFPVRDGRPSLRHENFCFSMTNPADGEEWDIVRLGKEVMTHYGSPGKPKFKSRLQCFTEQEAIERLRQAVGSKRANGWIDA